jgi:hypothetical protein
LTSSPYYSFSLPQNNSRWLSSYNRPQPHHPLTTFFWDHHDQTLKHTQKKKSCLTFCLVFTGLSAIESSRVHVYSMASFKVFHLLFSLACPFSSLRISLEPWMTTLRWPR